MNSAPEATLHALADRWITPGRSYRCEAEEISRARLRALSLRSALGVTGSGPGESLETVLATLIREGDAFAKWRESSEPLRNLYVVRRTRGLVTTATPLNAQTRIDVQDSKDSQIEVWECGEDMELRFPVYRLPLSSIENGRARRINERLRPDVLQSFDIKSDRDCASVAIDINGSPAINARDLLRTGFALWFKAREFLKPVVTGIVEFRSAELQAWNYQDVRNDPIYRLDDMFRPAMSLQ